MVAEVDPQNPDAYTLALLWFRLTLQKIAMKFNLLQYRIECLYGWTSNNSSTLRDRWMIIQINSIYKSACKLTKSIGSLKFLWGFGFGKRQLYCMIEKHDLSSDEDVLFVNLLALCVVRFVLLVLLPSLCHQAWKVLILNFELLWLIGRNSDICFRESISQLWLSSLAAAMADLLQERKLPTTLSCLRLI